MNSGSEADFVAQVGTARKDPARWPELIRMLNEAHPIYSGKGASAVVRMRGWLLLAVGETHQPDALVFILEELDNGRDAYSVAAAARALRAHSAPSASFAPFLARAIANIKYHDDVVNLDEYGNHALAPGSVSALTEVLRSVEWLGPLAHSILADIQQLAQDPHGEFSAEVVACAQGAMAAMGRSLSHVDGCCLAPDFLRGFRLWPKRSPGTPLDPGELEFEDHSGQRRRFIEFLAGKPAIVVFFYTRCENPQKCSLTIAKLTRVQQLLVEQHLDRSIRTAAVTYDPAYDLPSRLVNFCESRGMRLDPDHCAVRPVNDFDRWKEFFGLGVSFIGSLVNRHRVEVYVLDAAGRIALSFERISWAPDDVVDRAVALLEQRASGSSQVMAQAPSQFSKAALWLGSSGALSIATAFFPKCPMCWAAYMSALGLLGVGRVASAAWLLPLFAVLMLANLATIGWRSRVQGNMLGFYLAAAGSFSILALGWGLRVPYANWLGVALHVSGSLLAVLGRPRSLRTGAIGTGAADCSIKPHEIGTETLSHT